MPTVIDSTGLTRDRLDQIVANLGAALKAIYGADIDVSESSLDGQIIGSWAEGLSDLGQLLEQVYLSRSVAGATGASLSRLALLVGIARNPASYSTAAVTLSGTNGTIIPDGSLVDSTDTPAAHFRTVGDVTIGAGGTVAGLVRATTTGPVYAGPGVITDIKTVISGWTGCTNAAAVNSGSDQETDAALRVRMRASVAIPSQSIVDGLYAALANIQGVSESVVFENKTGATISRPGSADLPPNSIQAVIRGGLDADIAAAIWAKASAGVTLVGSTTTVITDAQGIQQTIRYDRPLPVALYADVFIRTSIGFDLTSAQISTIKGALVAYGNSTARLGRPVIYASLFAPVFLALGSTDVAAPYQILLGTHPNPLINSDLAIPFNGLASWDAGRIRVFSTQSDPLNV